MDEISIRDLRNDAAEVLDRLSRGESLILTREGQAIAELRPLPRKPVSAAVLLRRWRRLPCVDPDRLRADIDAVLGAGM